ncbi:E3 binding domain-containing protein [Bacillus licheniformis]
MPPGTVICQIGNENEQTPESQTKQPDPPKERIKISPAARKIAQSANLDIKTLKGTGPGGELRKRMCCRRFPTGRTSRRIRLKIVRRQAG